MNCRVFSLRNPKYFTILPNSDNNSEKITWDRVFWDGCSVRVQIEERVVVIEILNLDGDGGAGAEPSLCLLLSGHHHQQELPLVWILEVKFLKIRNH